MCVWASTPIKMRNYDFRDPFGRNQLVVTATTALDSLTAVNPLVNGEVHWDGQSGVESFSGQFEMDMRSWQTTVAQWDWFVLSELLHAHLYNYANLDFHGTVRAASAAASRGKGAPIAHKAMVEASLLFLGTSQSFPLEFDVLPLEPGTLRAKGRLPGHLLRLRCELVLPRSSLNRFPGSQEFFDHANVVLRANLLGSDSLRGMVTALPPVALGADVPPPPLSRKPNTTTNNKQPPTQQGGEESD